jgi:hypothetical protein
MPLWTLALVIAAVTGVRLGVDPLAADLLALLGAAVAAWSFGPDDPPRRPWLLRVVGVGLVLVAHALQRAGLAPALRPDVALLVIANILGAAAVAGFVRVVRGSGLGAPPGRAGTAVVAALAGIVAAAAAGVLVRLIAAAPDRAVVLAVSTVCDGVVFVGSALLLRLVLPLRGGLVAVPFLLLAADGLCYFLADLGHALGSPSLARALPWFEAIGGAAGATAGVAQAILLRRGALRT